MRKAYRSDLTDAQWEVIQSVLPKPKGGRSGRPRDYPLREIWNAIFYQAHTGCPWEDLPRDFPPRSTVHGYFQAWTQDATLDRVHAALREKVRTQAGREPQPSAGSLDSQSAKSTEKGG